MLNYYILFALTIEIHLLMNLSFLLIGCIVLFYDEVMISFSHKVEDEGSWK